MLRSQTLLYLSFCLMFSLSSCKKEDKEEELKYPISLKYKTYSKAKMRMWTIDGEIFDQEKINKFVGNSFDKSFNADFYQISFKSPDSADVRFPPALHGLWTYKVLDSSNIEFKGDVQLFFASVFRDQASLNRAFLIYKSNIYTQGLRIVSDPKLLPSTIYRADLGFGATGNKKTLSIPGYLYRMRLYKRASVMAGHMYGKFKESFLNELQDRDTLVIQETKNNWAL